MKNTKEIKYPRVLDWTNKVISIWTTKYKNKFKIEVLLKDRGNVQFILSKNLMKNFQKQITKRLE